MSIQTQAAAQTELDEVWYPARARLAEGKSFTFATENGTRTITEQDMKEVRTTITLLERRATTATGQRHNVMLPNFNH